MADDPAPPPDPTTRILLGVIGLLVLSLFAYAMTTYGELPARIPMHFNAAGDPDRFAARSWGSWLLLPIVGTLVCAVTVGGSQLITRLPPEKMNLPNKELFLALPRAEQLDIIRSFSRAFLATAVVWGLFFLTLLRTVFRVSTHRIERFESAPIFFAVGLVLALVIAGSVQMSRRIRRLSSQRGPS